MKPATVRSVEFAVSELLRPHWRRGQRRLEGPQKSLKNRLF
jgi:hypothetical protein